MTSKNVTQIESNIKPDDVDALEAEAAEHDRQAAEKRERARDLRSDRRNIPMSLAMIAKTIGVEECERPLTDAAKAGKYEAWRLGGAERGTLISTIANVERYLRTQPAAKVKPVKDAPVGDVYELAVRRARGGR